MKKYIDWETYYRKLKDLSEKVSKDYFDYVVCIGRGGFLIGDYLSRKLEKPLAVIMASSYVDKTNKQKDLIWSELASSQVVTGHVLLVDDLCDSGETLQEIKKVVSYHSNVSGVKTATIWVKEKSKFTPDYFVEKCKTEWICQPFEEIE